MNVLILSGIKPSRKNIFGGAFIGKKYILMKSIIDVDLYKIGKKYDFLYKSIVKLILKNKNIEDDIEISSCGIKWKNININVNLINKAIEKYNSAYYYKLNIRNIENRIDITKYDIIHAHWAYPTGYVAMILSKKYNIPYIVTSHGSDIHTIPKNNGKIAKYTLKVLENANKAIFVSESLRREALNLGYSGKNSEVIYNGVDLNDFKIVNKESCKVKLGFSKNTIGYIGRLEWIKGVDRIPKICKQLKEIIKDTEIIIIGDGTLKENMLKELEFYDIKYKYYKSMSQKDLNVYLNALDVVIIPSRNESFCCVALEAQAVGKKIVASNIGGLPEAIDKFGYLVDEGEQFCKRFALKISEALSTEVDYKDMINRARDFSWEKSTECDIKVYKEILKID